MEREREGSRHVLASCTKWVMASHRLFALFSYHYFPEIIHDKKFKKKTKEKDSATQTPKSSLSSFQ